MGERGDQDLSSMRVPGLSKNSADPESRFQVRRSRIRDPGSRIFAARHNTDIIGIYFSWHGTEIIGTDSFRHGPARHGTEHHCSLSASSVGLNIEQCQKTVTRLKMSAETSPPCLLENLFERKPVTNKLSLCKLTYPNDFGLIPSSDPMV